MNVSVMNGNGTGSSSPLKLVEHELRTIPQQTFLRMDGTRYFDPPRWNIEGIVLDGGVTVISAQPKVGKSTMAAHLAFAVATGRDFFGNSVSMPGEVIYFALERHHQTQERVLALRDRFGSDTKNVFLVHPQRTSLHYLALDQEESVKQWRQEIQREGRRPKLVIIDSLGNTFFGDTNSHTDGNRWFDGLQRLCQDSGAAAIVLHHDNKASGSGNASVAYKGTTAILARTDSYVHLKNCSGLVVAKLERDNYGAEWTGTFRFTDQSLLEEAKGEEIWQVALGVIEYQDDWISAGIWDDLVKAERGGKLSSSSGSQFRAKLVDELKKVEKQTRGNTDYYRARYS